MSDDTENSGRDPKGRFAPGNPGGGRPVGSRNKLGEKMLEDMLADWEQHGAAAIAKMREERPHEYVRAYVSILPRELKVQHLDEMTDDQIRNRLRQLAEGLGLSIGGLAGDRKTTGSADETPGTDEAPSLSRVH